MSIFDCLPFCASTSVKRDAKSIKPSTSSDTTALHAAGRGNRRRRSGSRSNSMVRDAATNPYHVLEVRRDATPCELRQSYRKLALLHHPGRCHGSPEERRRRVEHFELLAACFETLMHPESRRRIDLRLKDVANRQRSHPNHTTLSAGASTDEEYPRGLLDVKASSSSMKNSVRGNRRNQHSRRDPTVHRLLQGGATFSTVPELIRASSSRSSSDDEDQESRTKPSEMDPSLSVVASTGATIMSLSSIVSCAHPDGTASNSSDERKLTKSLMDSSASQASVDGTEIHFSEATVNRLFGGPMAPLHRARNFEPFTDPYEVFERVFGGPVFPRVKIEEIEGNLNGSSANDSLTIHNQERASVRLGGHHNPRPRRKHPLQYSSGWEGSAHKDPDGLTTVFVSSRVVRNRRITRTETITVDPLTGRATSSVTVSGEDLDPVPETESRTAVEWLLCCRTNLLAGEISYPSTSISRNESIRRVDLFGGLASVYHEILEDFYACNTDISTTCQRYMGCAQ